MAAVRSSTSSLCGSYQSPYGRASSPPTLFCRVWTSRRAPRRAALPPPGPGTQDHEQHERQTQVAQGGYEGGGRRRVPGPEATPASPAATTRGVPGGGGSARGCRPGDGHVGRGERPGEVGDRGLQGIGPTSGTRIAKRRGAAPIGGVEVRGADIRPRQDGEVDVHARQGGATAVREGRAHGRG